MVPRDYVLSCVRLNYAHRVAISNNRILVLQDDMVTFSWRDYADHNKVKQMTITAEEFIRRFMHGIWTKSY